MELKDYEVIGEAMDKAEDSVTPFVIADGGDITVVGDANNTELNMHDFKMRFRVPDKQEDGSVRYQVIEKEFKDVYITPRQDTKVLRLYTELMPFFKKIDENGGVSAMTKEEKLDVFTSFGDELFDLLYSVTATVLGIDDKLKEYMMPVDVVNAAAQIMRLYPEVVNEADTFFG